MTTLPALGIDPFSDDVLADPLEFHGRLRAAGAVVRLDQSEGFDIVGVGRDETVREIFDNPTIFLNSRGGGILDLVRDEPFREPGVLQETDPPYHDGARKVMAAIISPKNLRTMRERFQVEADALVDSLIDKGTFDAQIDMAQAYPLHVVPDSIMGARPEGRENLLRYSTWLFESMGPKTPRAQRVIDDIDNVAGAIGWVAESTRRENVAPHSFGARVWEAVDEGVITENEAALMVRSLVGAGVDTTIFALGICLHLLLDSPDQYARLHEQPAVGKFAFDEALRWGAPVRHLWRTPAADTEIDGIPVREGQKMMLVLGAANHDPQRWGPTADEFDMSRDTGGHIAMGRGIHACIGAPIARLEADVLLATFARRVKSIERTGESVPLLNNTLRGYTAIPMRIVPA